MPRIITVTDESLGIEARVYVDMSDETQGSKITKLQLVALEDRGIRPTDLLIFQELGLRLPDPNATLTPALVESAPVEQKALTSPPVEVEKKPRKQAAPKIASRTSLGGRTYYTRPSDTEIARLYAQFGYNQMELARYYDIPHHVVAKWITKLRGEGVDLPSPRRGSHDTLPTSGVTDAQ